LDVVNTREPGSVLDGKYEVVQRLGSGGMGEVYLVRHVHLQELRVIKILRQDLAADPASQKRFMREARLATQIKHPNVATLYDFASLPDGSFYMVWEHIQGQDVGVHIRSMGPFPVPVAVQLGIQALQGLEAVHATGVIHRDLSPDNLMITEEKTGQYRVRIIDLGLARTLEVDSTHEITQVGMFMGKLRYCSPEQAGVPASAVLDHRSDLYSLALVIYEMIAGVPPFESENQAGFIFKRLSEDPLSLVGRNPRVQVPPDLDRVVRKALERDRDLRFPDARSFIAALEKVGKSLNTAETREILIPQSVLTRPASTPAASATPAAPAATASAVPRSTPELSRAERLDLLAQIDRAAKRVQETSPQVAKAEAALAAGRLDEAEGLIAQVEAANPRAQGLSRLKARLQESQEKIAVVHRVSETEQVLANYLQKKQLPLARLAFDTLMELAPQHPKRADYQGWLDLLAQEAERDKRVEAALAAGREALGRQDVKAARRELEVVAKNDASGKRAETFAAELDEAEKNAKQGAETETHLRKLESALEGKKVQEAERELEALSRLGLFRVTFEFYRERVAELRNSLSREEKSAYYERCYREGIQEHNWFAAREVAMELEKVVPGSPRVAAMFAEVERLETLDRKQQSLEQGVRQVEAFLEQGDAAKAELALKILVQMDPENRHRKRLEKQVQGLKR